MRSRTPAITCKAHGNVINTALQQLLLNQPTLQLLLLKQLTSLADSVELWDPEENDDGASESLAADVVRRATDWRRWAAGAAAALGRARFMCSGGLLLLLLLLGEEASGEAFWAEGLLQRWHADSETLFCLYVDG